MWIESLVMLAFFGLTNSFLVWCIAELCGMYSGGKMLRELQDERAKLEQMQSWRVSGSVQLDMLRAANSGNGVVIEGEYEKLD